MDDYKAAKAGGGFKALSDELISTLSGSTQIFANAPAGTKAAELTIRGAPLCIRKGGGNASVTNGHDYAVGTWWFTGSEDELERYRGIQSGGTATIFVTYYGLA